jgi:glycerol-3-phosphate dehydrogenase subunit C
MDISEYLIDIAKTEGLMKDFKHSLPSVALHYACHSRAQNMGFKARDLLKLVPNTKVTVIERCSGHGGSFGVKKNTFDVAMKVGKPVFSRVKTLADKDPGTLCFSFRFHLFTHSFYSYHYCFRMSSCCRSYQPRN